MNSTFESGRHGLGAGDGAPTGGDGTQCRATMSQVIQTQIMPRLLQVTRRTTFSSIRATAAGLPAAEVEAFAQACAAGNRQACHALVERLRSSGLNPENLLVDLVAPAARLLGQSWDEDRLDFTSVTSGLMLMHEVVHAFGYEIQDGPTESGDIRRVMLASAPGSQHLLGLSIISEFFRNAGWQVVLEISTSGAELARAVSREWFDLVGVSVALDSQLADLPELVNRLRLASRNPLVPVMLGGPIFLLRDLDAQQFGAQAICVDARESLKIAQSLMGS